MGYDQLRAAPLDQFPERMVSPVQWQVDKSLGWRPRLVRAPFPAIDGERAVWAPSHQALLQAFPQRFLVNFGWARLIAARLACLLLPAWAGRRARQPAARGLSSGLAGLHAHPQPPAFMRTPPLPAGPRPLHRRHAMFDLAVPLFNLQHLWGVYRPDAQVRPRLHDSSVRLRAPGRPATRPAAHAAVLRGWRSAEAAAPRLAPSPSRRPLCARPRRC